MNKAIPIENTLSAKADGASAVGGYRGVMSRRQTGTPRTLNHSLRDSSTTSRREKLE